MRKYMLMGMLVFGIAIFVFSFAHRAACREDGYWDKQLREDKLGSIANMVENSLVISPDGARVACVIKNGEKQVVVIDGNAGKEYDGITAVCFSPDSQHVAFTAKSGGKFLAVDDGQEGKEYDEIGTMAFSPNGRRFAYAAMRERQWVVVVDGAETAPCPLTMSSPTFSPDSKRFAYISPVEMENVADPTKPVKKAMVVVDRVGGEQYDSIVPGTLVFSPDSRRVAYAAVKENKQMFVIDGVAGNACDAVSGFAFSVNSKHFAYAATLEGKGFVVVDGAEETKYDSTGAPLFSDDAQHLLYLARLGGKSLVVMDGTEGVRCDDIKPEGVLFSPDSKQFCYAAKRGEKWRQITEPVAPQKVEDEGAEGAPVQRLEFMGGKEYDDIKGASIAFSPDSKRLAYAASSGGKWMTVVDGKESAGYDDIFASIAFSSDSAHVVHFALSGEKWRLCADGEPVNNDAEQGYDRPVPGSRIVRAVAPPNRLYALAISGDKMFRVVIEFTKKTSAPEGAGEQPKP